MKKECLFHNTLLCSPDQNREANILSLYYNFIHLTCSDEITSNEAAKIIPCSVTTPQFEVVRVLLCLQNPANLFPRGKWNQRVEDAS